MPYIQVNPPSPSVLPIPGIQVGSRITIRGRVSVDAERFHINLQNGDSTNADVAFHFNPRNNEQSVVRNSYQGEWQHEEVDTPHFPFTYGSEFTIRMYVTEQGYTVYVNNGFYIKYDHRLCYKEVKHLELSQGAEYYKVAVESPSAFPYQRSLTPLKNGSAFRVRGCINENAKRFNIDFSNDEDGQTIAFHFNPRLDENATVLNTKKGGQWEGEERAYEWFPFQGGAYFEIYIVVHDGAFRICVNGDYYAEYTFRLPLEFIQFLSVDGDISLMSVDICEKSLNGTIVPLSNLKADDCIRVAGFFYQEGRRFFVNLMNGLDASDDISLHVNPRRDEQEVVLNNNTNGSWHNEERHPLPTKMGGMMPFAMDIFNRTDRFDIVINHRKLGTFMSRGLIQDIKGVLVGDDAYIHDIKVLSKRVIPSIEKLPTYLKPGNWMSLRGVPTKKAVQFAINLQNGDSLHTGSDIPLHYNPRFSEMQTVRNTMRNGGWGLEERQENEFPFDLDVEFEFSVLLADSKYKIFVNKKHHIDYSHRITSSDLSHLALKVDCDFYDVDFYF